jgi:hypothetical protein
LRPPRDFGEHVAELASHAHEIDALVPTHAARDVCEAHVASSSSPPSSSVADDDPAPFRSASSSAAPSPSSAEDTFVFFERVVVAASSSTTMHVEMLARHAQADDVWHSALPETVAHRSLLNAKRPPPSSPRTRATIAVAAISVVSPARASAAAR